jgi:MFS family permease
VLAAVPRAIRSLVLVALTVRLIDEWWSYLPAGIIENLRVDLGVSYEQAASLVGIAFLSGLIGGPLGALADFVNRKLIAIIGSALQTLGLVLFAIGDSYAPLVVGVLLLGAAGDLVIRPLESALAENIHEDELEHALGRQHLLSFFGDVLGPLTLGGAAILGMSWRSVFWLTAAALGLYTLSLFAVTFPTNSSTHSNDEDEPDTDTSTRSLLRNKQIWKLTLWEILIFPLDEPIAAFAVAAIALNQSALAQLIAGGYVVGGLAGSLIMERQGLSARIRTVGAPIIALGAALVAGSIALVELGPLSYVVGALLATLAMGVVGIGMALVWGDLHHRQLTLVPGRSATVASIVGTFGSVGAAWPWLAGRIADRHSITAALVLFCAAGIGMIGLARSFATR